MTKTIDVYWETEPFSATTLFKLKGLRGVYLICEVGTSNILRIGKGILGECIGKHLGEEELLAHVFAKKAVVRYAVVSEEEQAGLERWLIKKYEVLDVTLLKPSFPPILSSDD